jgi:ABC-type uncharacterized transport system permease subunit
VSEPRFSLRADVQTFKGRWRVERCLQVNPLARVVIKVAAVLFALFLAGVLVQVSGMSAASLASKALKGTLGSTYGLGQAAVLGTPLVLTGLAVALCMKMQLWNIGAEGQFFMGAWAAAAVGIHIQGPTLIVLVLMFLAGALAGSVWIAVPALARAWANVNEVISTLLLNFVAILFVNYFAIGPWRDKTVAMASASYWVPYELPNLFGSKAHLGIILAILVALGLGLMFQRTKWGYEINIIGSNRRAAEYAGMPVARHIVVVMMLSGAVAGLAGVVELSGVAHRLSGGISNEYGYLGILVAALANASPWAVIPVGLLLAVLLNAGIIMQTQGLSLNSVVAITGMILLFVAIGEVITRFRVVRAPMGESQDLDGGAVD